MHVRNRRKINRCSRSVSKNWRAKLAYACGFVLDTTFCGLVEQYSNDFGCTLATTLIAFFSGTFLALNQLERRLFDGANLDE
jgi:hypothetical protein